jgi:cobaltochelatase CobS
MIATEEQTTSISSKGVFDKLLERIQDRPPEWMQRITAHVRETSGHNTLTNFQNSSVPEAQKLKTYAVAMRSLVAAEAAEKIENLEDRAKALKAAWTGLAGSPPEPQPLTRDQLAEEQIRKEPVRSTVPGPKPAAQLAAAIQALLAEKNNTPIDEETVKAICEGILAEKFEEQLKKSQETVSEYLKAIPARDAIEIKTPDGTSKEVSGPYHWQLPQLIRWVDANVPLWLHSKAGAGKTHIVDQIAEAHDLTPYVISIDPTMTVGKLVGFRNLANGEFMEGFLYKPYKEGGLVLLDEIDTGDPGILAALNAMNANGHYTFPNGERVKRHPSFRVIAGANTKGTGAVAGYTARNRLDAATLDRFAVIELTYDPDLEFALATGKPIAARPPARVWSTAPFIPGCDERWVLWVQKVRQACGESVLVSPRASILGARAIRACIPPQEVAEACVFKLMTEDCKQRVIQSVGPFKPGGF